MTHTRRWLPWAMWSLGALCYLTALFHRMSLSVAGLTAQQRFEIDATGLAAFSVVQLVLYAVLQVPVGVAADRLGPRRLLLAGMALMALGSVAFAVSTSYATAMAGRALIGAGDAFMFINVLRLAHNWFPGRLYALVAALTGMIGGLGQLIATAPLAAMLDGFGWTAAFLTAGLITVALTVLVGFGLRERPAGARAVGLEPPREPVRVGLRGVWRNPGTWHALWTHFTLMGAFVAFTAVLGQPYLVGAHHLDPATASSLLAVVVIGFVLASTACGQLASRRPWLRGKLALGAAVCSTLAVVVLVAAPSPAPVAVLGPTLSVLGATGGVSMLAFDLARSANRDARSGIASGVANVGGFSYAVLAELGVGILLDVLLAHAVAPTSAYRLSFLLILALSLWGTFRLVRLHRHAGARPAEHAGTEHVGELAHAV